MSSIVDIHCGYCEESRNLGQFHGDTFETFTAELEQIAQFLQEHRHCLAEYNDKNKGVFLRGEY